MLQVMCYDYQHYYTKINNFYTPYYLHLLVDWTTTWYVIVTDWDRGVQAIWTLEPVQIVRRDRVAVEVLYLGVKPLIHQSGYLKVWWGYLYILKKTKQTRRVHYKTCTETYTISLCFTHCFYSIVLFHSGYLLTRKSLRISPSSSGTGIIKPGSITDIWVFDIFVLFGELNVSTDDRYSNVN